MKKTFHPDTTIIIFDIHGVLCKVSFAQMISVFWKSPCKFTLIKYSFNPRLLYNIIKLWRHNAIANEYFSYLATHYPHLAACIPLIIDMANAQVPNTPVFAIAQKLKKQGYALHILSNIDANILSGLCKTGCGSLFPLFDLIHGTKADDHYGKPHKEFFKHYIEQCNPGKKAMIFIDNRRNNVEMARKVGMTGILYKNPAQLIRTLQTFGITIS